MHFSSGIFQIPLAGTCDCLYSKPYFLFLTGSWFPSGTTTLPHFESWTFNNECMNPSVSKTSTRDSGKQKYPSSFLKIFSLPHWIWTKTAIASSYRGIRGTEKQSLTTVETETKEWREKEDIGHIHLSLNQITCKFQVFLLMAEWPQKLSINFSGLLFPRLCNSDNCTLLMVLCECCIIWQSYIFQENIKCSANEGFLSWPCP